MVFFVQTEAEYLSRLRIVLVSEVVLFGAGGGELRCQIARVVHSDLLVTLLKHCILLSSKFL